MELKKLNIFKEISDKLTGKNVVYYELHEKCINGYNKIARVFELTDNQIELALENNYHIVVKTDVISRVTETTLQEFLAFIELESATSLFLGLTDTVTIIE